MWKKKVTIVFIAFLSMSLMCQITSPIFAQDQAISKGIQWLKDNQAPDGYWGKETEPLPVLLLRTTNAANTLHYLNSRDATYQKAVQWIANQDVQDTRFLSRKIEALANAGSDISEFIKLLVSYQNNDGGWGGCVDYESDVILDTALALRALHY